MINIDTSIPPERSILLRYNQDPDFYPYLERVSIREGSRTTYLMDYKGVAIFVKDETTLMHTGTYKSLDAAFITAHCLKEGYNKIVFSSGANLGQAISEYTKRFSIKTVYFHPHTTKDKLSPDFFGETNNVVTVYKNEREVKRAATLFSEVSGFLEVPTIEWRLKASSFVGYSIFEDMQSQNFDWIAQAVCAAYGPIGIYHTLGKLHHQGRISRVPKFLGIQQEANSPMVKAWKDRKTEIQAHHLGSDPAHYIETALYNTNPSQSYVLLCKVLSQFGGDMVAVGEEFYKIHRAIADQLERKLIPLTRVNGNIVEKTGLITGVGILKAIDTGIIKRGETVLYLLTGGNAKGGNYGQITSQTIRAEDDLEESVRRLIKCFE